MTSDPWHDRTPCGDGRWSQHPRLCRDLEEQDLAEVAGGVAAEAPFQGGDEVVVRPRAHDLELERCGPALACTRSATTAERADLRLSEGPPG